MFIPIIVGIAFVVFVVFFDVKYRSKKTRHLCTRHHDERNTTHFDTNSNIVIN